MTRHTTNHPMNLHFISTSLADSALESKLWRIENTFAAAILLKYFLEQCSIFLMFVVHTFIRITQAASNSLVSAIGVASFGSTQINKSPETFSSSFLSAGFRSAAQVEFVVMIGGLHPVTKAARFQSFRNFVPKHAFARYC
jgi:hypothetical protein